jgi:hypothetical protein
MTDCRVRLVESAQAANRGPKQKKVPLILGVRAQSVVRELL